MVFRNLQPIREQRGLTSANHKAESVHVSQSECSVNAPPIGPDRPEEVQRLSEPVGGVVLSNHHVVAAARRHEDDGRHI